MASPLERFVEGHQERLIRLACLVTKNTADAADAVVRALDEGWRRQEQLRDESRLRARLDQLTVRDAVRLAERPSLLSLVTRDSGISWIEPTDPDGPSGKDTSDWDAVRAAFDALPTEQRAAVALHHYAGYTVEEVADLVDAPIEIVRARLRLATDRVRGELGQLASFRPRRDRDSDDIDSELPRFLHWRVEHLRGLPSAAQLAARVSEEPARRRAQRGPRIVWTATGLVTILLATFLIGPRPSPPVLAVASSPSAGAVGPLPSPAAIVPTVAPVPAPSPDVAACTANRVQIDGPGHPLPAAARGLVAPKGMQLATVVQSNEFSGDIVVAEDTPGSARVVGSFTGARYGYSVQATVWAWAADASALLVELGQAGPGPDPEDECSNLFMVRGYGAAAITDNGPGSALDHAALLLSSAGDGVFYLSGTSLHSVTADDQDRSVDLAGCEWQPQVTVLSADGNTLAFDCVRFPGADVLTYNVGIVDLLSGVGSFTQLERANLPSIGMVWTGPRSLLMALAEDTASPADEGRILLRDGIVGPTAISFTPRIETTYRTEWVVPAARFSPDANWLLSVGDANTSAEPYHTYLVDTHTGASTKLPWPVVNDSAPTLAFPIWLPGRRPRVVMWQDEHLYAVDLLAGTRVDLGAVPRVDNQPNVNFAIVPTPVGTGG